MKLIACLKPGKLIAAAILSTVVVSSAYAAPVDRGRGRGERVPPDVHCAVQAITSFDVTPAQIDLGGSVTVTWSAWFPGDCNINQVFINNSPVPLAGSQSLSPMSNTSYLLQAVVGPGIATLGTASVTVKLPNPVVIKDSTAEWRDLLIQAVGTPRTTVYLAHDVDMDMSGQLWIPIAAGVSLVGGKPCLDRAEGWLGRGRFALCGGRTAADSGPRLYTRSRPNGLFVISCTDPNAPSDNVHLSGFRLQGRDFDEKYNGDEAKGILIHSCLGTEIGNMELSGWSGAAIHIDNDPSRQHGPQDPLNLDQWKRSLDPVKVHDNFIHHNQHEEKDGYGVDVSSGAWATIERNVFDFNRHAVTAGYIIPKPFEGGYVANQNLVLKGGGWHGRFYKHTIQQFDVHGDKSCFTPSDSAFNCGHSGDRYWITNNAFQYTRDLAFQLRGTPAVGAYVNNNVFAHSKQQDAVATDGHGTIGLFVGQGPLANQFGKDTFGKYGVCDFDGDGHDGLFLATGASWWYMSSAKHQWVYLNSYTDTLDQLAVGDFEGTGHCDVFAVHGDEWLISSGGTRPWHSLGHFGVPFDQLRFGHFTGGKRMEIFRRAPSGQWSIISPGVFGWRNLQSSSIPLSQLHFGNFEGHGVTDVLAVANGHWSVSWGGRTSWQPLNLDLSDSLEGVLIADLDGKGIDDVVRYLPDAHDLGGRWQVSVRGRSPWQTLATMDVPHMFGGAYVGRFEGRKEAQLLAISLPESSPLFPLFPVEPRRSQILNRDTGTFMPYGEHAY